MKSASPLWVLVVVAFAFSCEDPISPPPTIELHPTTIGTQLIYRIRDTVVAGSDALSPDEHYTVTVENDTTAIGLQWIVLGGGEYYRLQLPRVARRLRRLLGFTRHTITSTFFQTPKCGLLPAMASCG